MVDARETFLEALGDGSPFLCSLATVGADSAPRVRFVRAKADPHLVLRIPTFATTQKVRDIRADPRVHITCGDTNAERPGTYFQIDGTAEIASDDAEREAAWTPRLSKWFSGPDDANYAVVKVTPTEITALPIGRAGAPSVWRASAW
jgi:general stress protein 26